MREVSYWFQSITCSVKSYDRHEQGWYLKPKLLNDRNQFPKYVPTRSATYLTTGTTIRRCSKCITERISRSISRFATILARFLTVSTNFATMRRLSSEESQLKLLKTIMLKLPQVILPVRLATIVIAADLSALMLAQQLLRKSTLVMVM